MIEPKFKQNDYIVNHASGDLAIVSQLDKNGYYHFKAYYGAMFKNLNDVKGTNFSLQINYQKFYELCNDEEKKQLDGIIKNPKKPNSENFFG